MLEYSQCFVGYEYGDLFALVMTKQQENIGLLVYKVYSISSDIYNYIQYTYIILNYVLMYFTCNYNTWHYQCSKTPFTIRVQI